MKRRHFIGSLASASAWAATSRLLAETKTGATSGEGAFRFVQIADTQLGFTAWGDDLSHEIANFERAVVHINQLRPAFVIISGDLINMPVTATKLAEFDRLRALIDPAIPVHVQPGNHDLGNTPSADSLAAYRARYGRDYFSFDVRGTHFINLNSQIIFDPLALPEETKRQWDWLVADLEKARRIEPDHIVVFTHYPWFLEDAEEDPPGDPLDHKNRGYFMIPLKTRRAYLQLLTEHGVRATFSGHYHGNVLGRSKGMEMVTSGPISKSVREGTTEGYRVVDVTPMEMTHRYLPL